VTRQCFACVGENQIVDTVGRGGGGIGTGGGATVDHDKVLEQSWRCTPSSLKQLSNENRVACGIGV